MINVYKFCSNEYILNICTNLVLFTKTCILKENAQFVEKVTFEPLMGSNKTIKEVGDTEKAAIFKSFLHLSYKNTITFLVDSGYTKI